MRHTYKTSGICPKSIEFDLEGDVVKNVTFNGGCNGNLTVISKLVDGFTVEQIKDKLAGNRCGPRTTSCADQLYKAVVAAHAKDE